MIRVIPSLEISTTYFHLLSFHSFQHLLHASSPFLLLVPSRRSCDCSRCFDDIVLYCQVAHDAQKIRMSISYSISDDKLSGPGKLFCFVDRYNMYASPQIHKAIGVPEYSLIRQYFQIDDVPGDHLFITSITSHPNLQKPLHFDPIWC